MLACCMFCCQIYLLRIFPVFIVSQLVSTIHVAEFNGSNQKTIYTVEDDIHSIAIDPVGGYVDVVLIPIAFTDHRGLEDVKNFM